MQTFNVAQVNNVAPARTKENRSVELAFAVAQRPPNSKFTIGTMNERLVFKCLEQRDVLDLPNPHFDIVGHKNKIAATKCDTPRLSGVGKRPLGLYLNFCQRSSARFCPDENPSLSTDTPKATPVKSTYPMPATLENA